jgi:hypothetical protein
MLVMILDFNFVEQISVGRNSIFVLFCLVVSVSFTRFFSLTHGEGFGRKQ